MALRSLWQASLQRPALATGLLLVATAVVLAIGRYAPFIDEPWGRDPASGNGAWYQGQPVLNWQRLGFAATRGRPMLGALPTDPPIGMLYAHHPTTFNWVVNAVVSTLGMRERTFRLVGIAFSTAAALILVGLAARRWGVPFAALVAVQWIVLPMTFIYGAMCNPEAATLCCILATMALHAARRNHRWWGYVLVLVMQFVAGQMDWEGAFVVPALFVYEIMQPRGQRRVRRVVALGCVSLLSALVTVAQQGYFVVVSDASMAAVVGAPGGLPDFAWTQIPSYILQGSRAAYGAAEVSVTAAAPVQGWPWVVRQWQLLSDHFTWPGMVLAGVGVIGAVWRRLERDALALALLVPGVLNILVFRSHAAQHEYWGWYLVPGVIVLATDALRMLTRERIIIALVLLAPIVYLSVRTIADKRREGATSEFVELARELDAVLERSDDILVCDVRFCTVTFYLRHDSAAQARSTRSWDDIGYLSELKKLGRLNRGMVFLIVRAGVEPPIDDLRRYGTIRRFEAAEVASRLPTLYHYAPDPLWLLRIE